MRTVAAIFILIFLSCSSVFAEELIGQYLAVTETEAVIKLTLEVGNLAVLVTSYLPTEPNEVYEPFIRKGKWSKKDDILILEINGLGTLQYKITPMLSYQEFGNNGGSFGFAPLPQNCDGFDHYGLWRASDLLKHFVK